jgi:hypothetical protein
MFRAAPVVNGVDGDERSLVAADRTTLCPDRDEEFGSVHRRASVYAL